jgi:hypothetical protein
MRTRRPADCSGRTTVEGSWRWSMTLGTPRPGDRYLRTRRPAESSYCTTVVRPWRDQDSPGTHPKNYRSVARRLRLSQSTARRFNRPHQMGAYWSTRGIRYASVLLLLESAGRRDECQYSAGRRLEEPISYLLPGISSPGILTVTRHNTLFRHFHTK